MKFLNESSCYYYYVPNSNKEILGFDLDSTLIKTKSGAKFPIDDKDWVFQYPNVKETLQKIKDKFNLVIFSNQKGLNNQSKINQFNQKINDIYTELGFEFSIFIATEDDIYRKPHTGMYKLFLKLSKFKDEDIETLIYCGDAAGRLFSNGTKDFSISDNYFAYNIDSEFKLPEDLFKVKKESAKIIDQYDKINLLNSIQEKKSEELEKLKESKDIKVLVLLVGLPACGKSTIVRKYFSGWKVISMDIIKNKKKMMDGFNDCINHGLNVIVDNTNYTLEQRKVFIDIANKKSYKVKILFQDIPFEICNHLNNFRVEKGEKDKISIITYRKMLKYFEKPTYKEGEIIRLTKIYDFDDKTVYDYKFS